MTGKSLRYLRLLLWGGVLAAGLGASWFFLLGGGAGPDRSELVTDELGRGDYRLITTEGREFTQDSLAGQPALVFFGFTHCPDVCPTTLADIAAWKEELGDRGDALRVFFVTVDPQRDTLEVLHAYTSWLPGVIGVTGSAREIARALEAFHIYARKVPLEDGEYSMDHSAYVMLFDRDGRFDQVIAYQEDPERVLSKLRHALEAAR
ncbi:SCO family protein [Paracoccus seriniphilus]|uniref:Protein SCO1/2 n=1 Tax=Paracoccus seriniphilus TaxID=184748 RepID=A0A239Q332_9RHOB|nr:SCO family protein [Paracoccus seriniphilus]WCR15343.1 SCO family protein [Paracoccus seriniphilus]SNT76905.1 protein SCO1/2 [Paracoccus seriniphilus]